MTPPLFLQRPTRRTLTFNLHLSQGILLKACCVPLFPLLSTLKRAFFFPDVYFVKDGKAPRVYWQDGDRFALYAPGADCGMLSYWSL